MSSKQDSRSDIDEQPPKRKGSEDHVGHTASGSDLSWRQRRNAAARGSAVSVLTESSFAPNDECEGVGAIAIGGRSDRLRDTFGSPSVPIGDVETPHALAYLVEQEQDYESDDDNDILPDHLVKPVDDKCTKTRSVCGFVTLVAAVEISLSQTQPQPGSSLQPSPPTSSAFRSQPPTQPPTTFPPISNAPSFQSPISLS